MPRQRIHHRRDNLDIPDDFPERLRRLQEGSQMSWSEVARRLETYRNIVWRRKVGFAWPDKQHRRDLLQLADSMVPVHLFTDRLSWPPAGLDSPNLTSWVWV